MARCLVLENYSVERAGDSCLATLEAWEDKVVEAFAGIVRTAFPGSGFRRTGTPRPGFLGFQQQLRLTGAIPGDGIRQVEAFLELVSRCLTIEDLLDESHALAYHQEQDEETGQLIKTRLGRLVNQAKYKTYRQPREAVGNAVIEFIKGHPRYSRATAIACMPPHGTGKRSSLSARVVNQVREALQLEEAIIVRTKSRPAQKDITDDDRRVGVKKRIANQKHSMRADTDLRGKAVIIIDDLYGSGGSMQEAARVSREAGASEVLGLSITKQRLFEGVSLVLGS